MLVSRFQERSERTRELVLGSARVRVRVREQERAPTVQTQELHTEIPERPVCLRDFEFFESLNGQPEVRVWTKRSQQRPRGYAVGTLSVTPEHGDAQNTHHPGSRYRALYEIHFGRL